MAGQNLTGFDAALKEVYGPRIEEQLNMVNVLQDWIDENDTAEWTGRVVKYPLHVGRNEGVGASAEGDPLPAAGNQSYTDVSIYAKYNYGRVQLSGQVIKASLKNEGAFTRAMESEIKGLVKDMANDRERQSFGAGTGVLALINGAQCLTNSVTITVDSAFGVTATVGSRFINPNMILASMNPSTTAIEATFTVSSVPSGAGTTFVIGATQSVTLSDNGRLVRAKSVAGVTTDGTKNNFNNEVVGLLGIIDDGTSLNTLSGINRTTYPVFKSTVIGSVGQLTLDVIQRGIDASDELGGGNFGADGVFFCHHSVRREYLKLLQADRRYAGADLGSPDGGTKGAALKKGGEITYGNRPWKIAKHCPHGTLFGTLKGSVVRYINVRGEWADEDERIFRNVAGYDAWEAFYRIFDNYHSDRPNESFRLDGITATVGNVNHIY